jgi:hypothetical protein
MLNAPFCLGSLYRSFACVQGCLSVAGDFYNVIDAIGSQSPDSFPQLIACEQNLVRPAREAICLSLSERHVAITSAPS